MGAQHRLLGVWNCQLGVWNCLLGVWNCLLESGIVFWLSGFVFLGVRTCLFGGLACGSQHEVKRNPRIPEQDWTDMGLKDKQSLLRQICSCFLPPSSELTRDRAFLSKCDHIAWLRHALTLGQATHTCHVTLVDGDAPAKTTRIGNPSPEREQAWQAGRVQERLCCVVHSLASTSLLARA